LTAVGGLAGYLADPLGYSGWLASAGLPDARSATAAGLAAGVLLFGVLGIFARSKPVDRNYYGGQQIRAWLDEWKHSPEMTVAKLKRLDAQEVPPLAAMLERVRRHALDGLPGIGEPALPVLSRFLVESRDLKVQRYAAEAIRNV